jgi:hypothetical protein
MTMIPEAAIRVVRAALAFVTYSASFQAQALLCDLSKVLWELVSLPT